MTQADVPEPTPEDDVIDKQERIEFVIDQRIAVALAEMEPVGVSLNRTCRLRAESVIGPYDQLVDTWLEVEVPDSELFDLTTPDRVLVTQGGLYAVLMTAQTTAELSIQLGRIGNPFPSAPHITAPVISGFSWAIASGVFRLDVGDGFALPVTTTGDLNYAAMEISAIALD